MAHTTRQRLISVAVQHFGRDNLAARLKTSPDVIDAWDRGQQAIPNLKLLALIDLLDEVDALGQSGESGPS